MFSPKIPNENSISIEPLAQNPHGKLPQNIQAKLEINQPGDEYEKEADEMAQRVVQRKEGTDGNSLPPDDGGRIIPHGYVVSGPSLIKKSGKLMRSTGVKRFTPGIVRSTGITRFDSPIMRKQSAGENIEASSGFQNKLNSTKGSGTPLPESVKGEMESGFGADFSGVKLHTDSNAVQMSEEINAQAFTHGNDIYFNSGKLDVGSDSGKGLLAHELTHTLQNSGSLIQRKIRNAYYNYDNSGVKGQLKNPADKTLASWAYKIDLVLEQSQKDDPLLYDFIDKIDQPVDVSYRELPSKKAGTQITVDTMGQTHPFTMRKETAPAVNEAKFNNEFDYHKFYNTPAFLQWKTDINSTDASVVQQATDTYNAWIANKDFKVAAKPATVEYTSRFEIYLDFNKIDEINNRQPDFKREYAEVLRHEFGHVLFEWFNGINKETGEVLNYKGDPNEKFAQETGDQFGKTNKPEFNVQNIKNRMKDIIEAENNR